MVNRAHVSGAVVIISAASMFPIVNHQPPPAVVKSPAVAELGTTARGDLGTPIPPTYGIGIGVTSTNNAITYHPTFTLAGGNAVVTLPPLG